MKLDDIMKYYGVQNAETYRLNPNELHLIINAICKSTKIEYEVYMRPWGIGVYGEINNTSLEVGVIVNGYIVNKSRSDLYFILLEHDGFETHENKSNIISILRNYIM